MEHPQGLDCLGVFHRGRKDPTWVLEKREVKLKERGIPKGAKPTGFSW